MIRQQNVLVKSKLKTDFGVFWFSLLACFLLCSSVTAQNRSLEKLVSYVMHSETGLSEVPGMVVAVIDRDSTYFFRFGEKEKGIAEPPTEFDVFEIGSVTKVLTASLYSVLDEGGKLSFEDKINEYYDNKFPLLGDLTIDDLLTHSSGLPKLPMNLGEHQSNSADPYADYGRKELIEFLYAFDDFDKTYHYSHVGYAFLGEILKKKTGIPYPTLLEQYLLEPLGLKHTFLGSETPTTFGYSLSGNKVVPWSFRIFNSSLGARSTASDLSKFVSAILDDEHPLCAALEKTYEEQCESSIPKVWMGRGWHLFRPKKNFYDVVAHSGVTGGHRTYIGFVKETHTAVILLSNNEATLSGAGNILLQAVNNNWRKKGKKKP